MVFEDLGWGCDGCLVIIFLKKEKMRKSKSRYEEDVVELRLASLVSHGLVKFKVNSANGPSGSQTQPEKTHGETTPCFFF